jgi:hypothetical protein
LARIMSVALDHVSRRMRETRGRAAICSRFAASSLGAAAIS